MIVKKVAKMRKAGGGSFGGLAHYLMDEKNSNEKVEEFLFSNCNFAHNYQANLEEIQSTQLVNTVSQTDKTYHLIVSFQEDENPSSETIHKIEEEFIKALGYEEHQRLSVVHNNTNNLHLHIAINKINPNTFTIKDPFRDIKILQEKAVELEEIFHLKRDNHTKKIDAEPTKIKDKEIHSGVQSFLSWIKNEAGNEIKAVLNDRNTSFDDLQKTLNKYNLELRERGAGLVISDKNRSLFVKASDVERGLSKNNVLKRYGTLKAANETQEQALTRFGEKKASLWDEYQTQMKAIKTNKIELLEKLSSASAEEFDEFKEIYAKRREYIKSNPRTSIEVKRAAYKYLAEERKKEFTEIKLKVSRVRTKIYQENKTLSFVEFLQQKAEQGDKNAIKTLQRKEQKLNGNVIESKSENNAKILPGVKANFGKNGIIFYKLGNAKIIDNGNVIKLCGDHQNEKNIKEFLDLAKIKFGVNPIEIKGTNNFKAQVQKSIEEQKINLKVNSQNQKNTFDAIKKRIEEKHNAKRGKLIAADDSRRWESYFANARAYLTSAREQFKNVIERLGDSSRTRGETIRERIIDVCHFKGGSIRKENGIETTTVTATTTNRGRNATVSRVNQENSKNARVGGMSK